MILWVWTIGPTIIVSTTPFRVCRFYHFLEFLAAHEARTLIIPRMNIAYSTTQLESIPRHPKILKLTNMEVGSSTSTSIPLNVLQTGQGRVTQREGHHSGTSQSHILDDPNVDPTLEESRLADSSVPDGGHGWVVIAACGVVSWWYTGTSYSWGIIQDALVSEGVGSPATLSFVGSLSTALISALAIVNARAIRWMGSQMTGILGVSFLGLSALTTSFSVKNVAGLFFTSGVLLGLGLRYAVSSRPKKNEWDQ